MSGLFVRHQTISNTENRVGALRVQSSSQGLPVPLVYGTTRISTNMLWYGNFQAIPHTDTQEAGGKGGGTTVTNTTYTYSVGVIFGLCEGPLQSGSVVNVWKDKELTGLVGQSLTAFVGSQGQAPWSYLTASYPLQAIGYSSTAYVAADAFPLGSSDSTPNMSFEVLGLYGKPYGERSVTVTSLCTPDVNPADVLRDVLTDRCYGLGLDGEALNDSDFALYCAAANFMVSPAYVQQRAASDIVTELARIGNSEVVWSPSAGAILVIPYADENVSHTPFLPGGGPNPSCCVVGDEVTYTPLLAPAYALGPSDFLAAPGADPVHVTRKRQADAYNAVQVECLNRADSYSIAVVEAKDQASIDRYGLRVMEPVVLHAICDTSIARAVAQTILQRELYVRNTYEFTLGYRFCRLEPMDIVSLTEPGLGLSGQLVRVKEITETEDFELQVVAEELTVGTATAADAAVQPQSGYVVNNNVNPGNANPPVIFQPPVELSGVPQIWLGSSGGADWGGAQVWASNDGSTYALVGQLDGPARHGTLTANFPAAGSPDTTNTLSVSLAVSKGTLTDATAAQADQLNTLSYVGQDGLGELIAYSAVTLTAPNAYDLGTYILRGQRCTVGEAHLAGAQFMRLDAAVGKFGVTEATVGTTVYVKLLSFNKTGGGLQSLDSVSPTSYVVKPIGVVPAGGSVPSTITAAQALCVPPNAQYLVQGRMTCFGRINCDGRLIAAA